MLGPDEPFDTLDRQTPGQLDRWWTRRLKNSLALAARELPFYRERFAAVGFDPGSFRRLEDLAGVPVFDKREVLEAQRRTGSHEIGIELHRGPRGARTLSLSSGTAGTTLVSHDPEWRRRQGYSSARAHWWAGLRGGAPFVLSAPAWHAYAAVQPYIAQRFDMPCIVVSGTYLPRFADRIVDAFRRFRPSFVTMFLPMVFSIVAAGRRMGFEPTAVFGGVETLVVTGAPITPGMRASLQQTTGVARVAEIAGTSENLLAVDCREADGLHVVPDTCYVEVLERETRAPVPPGERGSIVHSYTVAAGSVYLRYDGGDAGVIERSPCPCGLPSPRIKLMGRWETSFRLGGRTLLPYDVQRAVEEAVPELAGTPFVLVREALAEGRLKILLSRAEGDSTSLADAARDAVARRFAIPVEVAWVSDLPLQFKGVPSVLSEKEIV